MVTLTTENGKYQIPELLMRPSHFIDRTTVVYGPSGTGKTVIVKNIMETLRDSIDQIIVVAPSEPTNRSYAGFVDPTLIHYRMYLANDPVDKKKEAEVAATKRFLDMIYKRQDAMASLYSIANNLENLQSLYNRLTSSEKRTGDAGIAKLMAYQKNIVKGIQLRYARDPGLSYQKIEEVKKRTEQMCALIYKKALLPAAERLWKCPDLSEDERYALQYIQLNPRLLLIFDDCGAQLKRVFLDESFRKLFYQNRHSYITFILCLQDDTDLPANLRKNAFVSIFTSPSIATSVLTRSSHHFSKKDKDYVADILPVVFVGNRKLIYLREDEKHFYHLTCKLPCPFNFGSKALQELCQAVRMEGTTIDETNPFYKKFRL